jgi:hypothetical protein
MCVHAEWKTLLYLLCGCENTTFLCERRNKAFEIGVLKYPHFDRNSPTRIQVEETLVGNPVKCLDFSILVFELG